MIILVFLSLTPVLVSSKASWISFSKPFSQIENNFSRQFDGTGLGLAISKKFMELMNGTIEVQSFFGEGSIFTIKIEKISPAAQLKRDSRSNALVLD